MFDSASPDHTTSGDPTPATAGIPGAATTIFVCVTCRAPGEPADAARVGETPAEATIAAAIGASDITVRRVRCLANCSRGPSAAIRRPGAWTYVFGGLDAAQDGPALCAGARLLAASADGLLPWGGRPNALKRGLIARVPPLDLQEKVP